MEQKVKMSEPLVNPMNEQLKHWKLLYSLFVLCVLVTVPIEFQLC